MRDIEALLDDADGQISVIERLYEDALRAKAPTPLLQARIKCTLEQQRSALDYLAHRIVERYGRKGAKTYYPLAWSAKDFPAWFAKNMPDVAASQPEIRDAIKRHQPYRRDHKWLKWLIELVNENKHRALTPQKRQEERRIRVSTQGAGPVEWDPGRATFGRALVRGVPINPSTQRPIPTATQTVKETIYVDWLFAKPRVPALQALEEIQEGVRDAVPR